MEEADTKQIVSGEFTIVDEYNVDNGYEYYVNDIADTKAPFIELYRKLIIMGYIPTLKRSGKRLRISITKEINVSSQRRIIPLILFVVTLAILAIDGYFRYNDSPTFMMDVLIYPIALLLFILIHEMGHIIMNKRWKIKTGMPYLIPGIPGVVPFMGALTINKYPPINKDHQFDVGYSGILTGLTIAIVLFILGVFFPITATSLHPPALPLALLIFNYKNPSIVASPLMLASLFTLLISFLNFLPIWQLDGGHMISSLMKGNRRIITDFVSIIIISLMGFFYLAFIIIILASWMQGQEPLDSISSISNSRKYIYILIVVLMIITFVLFLTPLIYY